MAGRVEGKVAIITGGTAGIGEATARRFAREGARVALLARGESAGRKTEDSIRAEGGDATFIACDVTDRVHVESAVSKVVEIYGRVNVLFNNAGGGARAAFPAESEEQWDQVLRLNLTSTFLVSRAVWPHLIAAGGGVIINMSSQGAVAGMTDALIDIAQAVPSSSYYAAKAGIEAFTRYIAGIGGRHNIRVNCIRPGQVLTARLMTKKGEHAYKPMFDLLQMLKYAATPEDIANTVLFLASDDARFITAEIMDIDGGLVGKV